MQYFTHKMYDFQLVLRINSNYFSNLYLANLSNGNVKYFL